MSCHVNIPVRIVAWTAFRLGRFVKIIVMRATETLVVRGLGLEQLQQLQGSGFHFQVIMRPFG